MKTFKIPLYHIIIENGSDILISDCRQILSYSETLISIRVSGAEIEIVGDRLYLCDFFGSEVRIKGCIEKVSISKSGKERS
ncbi:MAG: YabP/YqfC family sporulation protein [Clostridia bacterium]|nr:YabP/YqfC family sporulation protein [Clostridia bacterium]